MKFYSVQSEMQAYVAEWFHDRRDILDACMDGFEPVSLRHVVEWINSETPSLYLGIDGIIQVRTQT